MGGFLCAHHINFPNEETVVLDEFGFRHRAGLLFSADADGLGDGNLRQCRIGGLGGFLRKRDGAFDGNVCILRVGSLRWRG
jgi:hypothetical protein